MNIITIHHEPVELYKILKFESLVGGGGEAKMLISAGHVLLNGEVEIQKRKKIVSGDIIEFDGETYQIELGEALPLGQEPSEPLPYKAAPSKAPKTKHTKPQQREALVVNKSKRSSISF